eukprot:CAMPEP_0178461608 /NCGR_PEP_ID=MMETSP0689_2-20121128/49402_1 /TAXON_ID=160604 /ORGANISM="Amphidinium massartii, Strain CS-259" /LENGTH=112 /DNA_ID=CAMNT_0020088459 /DNA_START=679 /DNA_END=1014 /DNA_ORIENTATION=-
MGQACPCLQPLRKTDSSNSCQAWVEQDVKVGDALLLRKEDCGLSSLERQSVRKAKHRTANAQGDVNHHKPNTSTDPSQHPRFPAGRPGAQGRPLVGLREKQLHHLWQCNQLR